MERGVVALDGDEVGCDRLGDDRVWSGRQTQHSVGLADVYIDNTQLIQIDVYMFIFNVQHHV